MKPAINQPVTVATILLESWCQSKHYGGLY